MDIHAQNQAIALSDCDIPAKLNAMTQFFKEQINLIHPLPRLLQSIPEKLFSI